MFRLYESDRPGFFFGVMGTSGITAARETFYAAQTWCRATLPLDSWHPEQWTVVVHTPAAAALFKIRWC